MRQIQEPEIRKPEPAQTIPKACGFEADTQRQPAEKEGDLKKQSQSKPNKANINPAEGAGKRKKSLAAATR